MDNKALCAELMRDEGEVLHAYQDSLGYWTIGVGLCIDARAGAGITHAESQVLLASRLKTLTLALQDKLGFWHRLDGVRQRALANMCFQMGIDGLMRFHRMLSALEIGRWQDAHDECLDSLYARQTPARAQRIAHMLATGVEPL
jgi:lysozyme